MFIFICSGCQDYSQIENPGSFRRIAPSHCNLMSNKRQTGEKAVVRRGNRSRPSGCRIQFSRANHDCLPRVGANAAQDAFGQRLVRSTARPYGSAVSSKTNSFAYVGLVTERSSVDIVVWAVDAVLVALVCGEG